MDLEHGPIAGQFVDDLLSLLQETVSRHTPLLLAELRRHCLRGRLGCSQLRTLLLGGIKGLKITPLEGTGLTIYLESGDGSIAVKGRGVEQSLTTLEWEQEGAGGEQ